MHRFSIEQMKIIVKKNVSCCSFEEYKALFAPFANCLDFIHKDKYQELFNEHVEQALEFVKNLKEEDFKAKVRLKNKVQFHFCCRSFSPHRRFSIYYRH